MIRLSRILRHTNNRPRVTAAATSYSAQFNSYTVSTGAQLALVLTPNGYSKATVTITVSDGNLSSNTATFNGAGAVTLIYTAPAVNEIVSVSFSNNSNLPNPAPQSITVSGGATATTYTSSPASNSVVVNGQTTFTLTPNGTSTASVFLTAALGSFDLPTVIFNGSGAQQTTYTAPGSAGNDTISYSNDSGLVDPAPTDITVTTSPATSYTATPQSTVMSPSTSQPWTFTPNGPTSVTVTPSASGGSFSPATVTFDGTTNPKISTYSAPTGTGNITVSYSNSGTLANPGNTTINVESFALAAPTVKVALAGAVIVTSPMASGGTPPYTSYQFQSSSDNVTWHNFGTASAVRTAMETADNSNPNFTVSTSAVTRYYRTVSTDSGANQTTSPVTSILLPASTAGSSVQVFPTEVSRAQSLAAANDAVQWQPFKTACDNGSSIHQGYQVGINRVIGGYAESDYEGSNTVNCGNYAQAYIALVGTDPTTAQGYADKAIAAMLNAATGLVRGNYSTAKFLARGDGVTISFTIPDSDYVSATLKIFTCPVAVNPVTKGATNGQDNYNPTTGNGCLVIKVSNTCDGSADYVQYTDWWQNFNTYSEYYIDWSLAQSQPSTGATYYPTYAEVRTLSQKTTGFSVAGTTITFTTPPANMRSGTTLSCSSSTPTQVSDSSYSFVSGDVGQSIFITAGTGFKTSNATSFTISSVAAGVATLSASPLSNPAASASGGAWYIPGQAVCVEYIHGTHAVDYSTLAYQQTSNGMGGAASNANIDGGYAMRYLQCCAYAYDWMWNYPGFTWTAKATVAQAMIGWWNYLVNVGGTGMAIPHTNGIVNSASNYGAGYFAMLTAAALALENREVAAAPALKTAATTQYTSSVQPQIVNAPTSTLGTCQGGHYAEGWNYGQQAVENLIIGTLLASEASWYTPSDVKSWTNDVINALLTEELTKGGFIYCGGDGYAFPEPSPTASEMTWFLAHFATDSTLKSYANYAAQYYLSPSTSNFRTTPNGFHQLLFYDPSGVATDWSSSLALANEYPGMGLIISRKDWTYNSAWISFHCGNSTNGSHQPLCQGAFEIWRGSNDLIPLAEGMTGDQGLPDKSKYGSSILIDDFGAGYMAYPSTSGGPNQNYTQSYINPAGCSIDRWEDQAAYTYFSGNYISVFCNRSQLSKEACTELNRSGLFIRSGNTNGDSYLVIHDRVTVQSIGASWLKQFQFPFNPKCFPNITISGTSFTLTRDSSRLFGEVFSDVPLTASHNEYILAPEQSGSSLSCANATSATPTITSASSIFPVQYNGSLLQITGGTNWLTGFYHIANCAGTSCTLDRACGSVGSLSGGVFKLGGIEQLAVVQTSNVNTKVRYRTGFQIAPSTVGSGDTITDIPSIDSVCEGTRIGNVVAMFGVNGNFSTGCSYAVTAGNGTTVTHYVSDLLANHLYTLTGANQASVTSTAAGVATFTTTGTGSSQTITLTA